MDDIKAKQQIVDKIKESTSVLVTVSNSPSVDALSAALGLALIIDKLDKHATAVFSGEAPAAITFLEPEKTFEQTTDSLRDFIIALDKEKADHLRLKVEGDIAKIYVTPFRTTITSDDLTFSQGDFNVELVIAIGVDNQDHLDGALDSHGQILHDAPIITITAGKQVSKLGGIDWHDDHASSLSEMINGLGEALKDKERLMDKQIATALLTGIVAATDRFSNPQTTSAVMTVAAQLMADGADQQLIAAELEKPQEVPTTHRADKPIKVKKADGSGSVDIVHGETLAEMDARVKAKEAKDDEANEKPAHHLAKDDADSGDIKEVHSKVDSPLRDHEPSMGGTLNATTDEAADDNRRALESDQNKTILSHTYVASDDKTPAMSGADIEEGDDVVDPLSGPEPASSPESEPTDPAPVEEPKKETPEPAEAHHEQDEHGDVATSDLGVHSAYAMDPEPGDAVEPNVAPSAPEPTPVAPAPVTTPTPTDLGLPMPPPIPDFSALQSNVTAAYAPAAGPAPMPERLGDILAPEPAPTSTTAPVPVIVPEPAAPVAPAPIVPLTPPGPVDQTPPTSAVTPNDPAQFKIPGQS